MAATSATGEADLDLKNIYAYMQSKEFSGFGIFIQAMEVSKVGGRQVNGFA